MKKSIIPGAAQISLAVLLETNDDCKKIQASRQSTRTSAGCQCKAVKTDKQAVPKLKTDLISFLQFYSNGSPIGGDEGETEDVVKLFSLTPEAVQKLSKTELLSHLKVVHRVRRHIPKSDEVGGWYYTQCSVCVANECACVVLGMECDSAVCGCSAVPTPTYCVPVGNAAADAPPPMPTYGYTGICRNPSGRKGYRSDIVKKYRQELIANTSNTSCSDRIRD